MPQDTALHHIPVFYVLIEAIGLYFPPLAWSAEKNCLYFQRETDHKEIISMKSIKMILLLAVSMLTLGAFAQQNPPPPGPPGGGRGPMSVDDQLKGLTDRLNLTA